MSVLEAVNLMLRTIGQAPISSLAIVDTNTDAEIAKQVLTDTSREVQEMGWHWNIEKKYLIEPDLNGYLWLPNNTLKVDTVYKSKKTMDLVERGNRLYDRVEHTFVVNKEAYVDVVVLLDFEDLPQVAKWYITVKAARVFADNRISSETTHRFSQDDENRAFNNLQSADAENDDRTMAQASPHVARMRRR